MRERGNESERVVRGVFAEARMDESKSRLGRTWPRTRSSLWARVAFRRNAGATGGWATQLTAWFLRSV